MTLTSINLRLNHNLPKSGVHHLVSDGEETGYTGSSQDDGELFRATSVKRKRQLYSPGTC